ncbi:MAG: hypothetical protein J1F68_04345 [Clostridiales bacterium]|nr:hypothetical protein [Clostridiales bacterium]
MIEEVVNSILEAEDVAKRRIAEAEAKASEIVAQAEIQAETLRKQASASNKERQAKSLTEADAEAERQASELLERLNAKTDSELTQLEKRIQGAVKVILESL